MAFLADTNVCSKWESDPAVSKNWQAARTELESRGHQYVACPLVLIELLARLVKPEPKYFPKDLKSFVFLQTNQRKFLPLPGYFVVKTVLGVDSPVTALHPADFDQMLQCIVSATSREAISSGDVELPISTQISYGLDFEKIRLPRDQGIREYAKSMTSMRQGGCVPTRTQHARGILSNLGIIPVNGDLDAVADAVDAAFEYERFLLSDVGPTYDYLKHSSDWVDRQLLYYLADPAMFIVTNDRKIRDRCGRSKQSERVIVI
jgi:hypothetical protein